MGSFNPPDSEGSRTFLTRLNEREAVASLGKVLRSVFPLDGDADDRRTRSSASVR